MKHYILREDVEKILDEYEDTYGYIEVAAEKISCELKLLETHEVNEWIPVSERLPETGYYFAFYTDLGEKMVVEGYYNKDTNEWDDGCFSIKPSHWQPLPKPPITTN